MFLFKFAESVIFNPSTFNMYVSFTETITQVPSEAVAISVTFRKLGVVRLIYNDGFGGFCIPK